MPSRPLCALAIALLAACADPTLACDLCTTSALVYGSVTTSGSEPVGGIPVSAYVDSDPCAVRAATGEVGRAVTNAAGRYRLQLRSPMAAPRCVEVEASATSGETVRTEVSAIRFKPTGSLPYDSVRVDIRVP